MRYLPHTDEQIASMLKTINVKTLEELFLTIPEDCRRDEMSQFPEPLSELELNNHMDTLANRMAISPEYKVFLGAGNYDHFIPESISYLIGRSEFSTAYTPYQPEMSQGTLQTIFEYQTLMSRLLGMEVANASMYDGASSLAEALLMAIRITRKKRVVLSEAIHPLYRQVVNTYFGPTDYEVITLPYLEKGTTDISSITEIDDLACVAVQSPNFFGCIEDLSIASDIVHQQGALFVLCFTEPLAFGLFKNPGEHGADIACGEGQSLGLPQSFGGPGLGIFTTRNKYVRSMPGRLVGETTERGGSKGYVLTLATREQHIRRERATSNICSNQSLCATASAMYLAALGSTGLRELSRLNFDKCEYLKARFNEAGFTIPFENPTFNEFVVVFPDNFWTVYRRLVSKKIVPGLPLETYYPELRGHFLVTATETKSKEDMDIFVKELLL